MSRTPTDRATRLSAEDVAIDAAMRGEPDADDEFTRELERARAVDQPLCLTCGAPTGATSGCEECAEWMQEMIHYGEIPGPDWSRG